MAKILITASIFFFTNLAVAQNPVPYPDIGGGNGGKVNPGKGHKPGDEGSDGAIKGSAVKGDGGGKVSTNRNSGKVKHEGKGTTTILNPTIGNQ
jgi:hypothetical protein